MCIKTNPSHAQKQVMGASGPEQNRHRPFNAHALLLPPDRVTHRLNGIKDLRLGQRAS